MAEVKWHEGRVWAEVDAKAEHLIGDIAMAVRREAQDSMRGPKTGRRYRVPGTKREYTASAPGEAPAVRLGILRASILVHFLGKKHARVRTDQDNGLETGTRKMAARPYLRPALDKVAARVRRGDKP